MKLLELMPGLGELHSLGLSHKYCVYCYVFIGDCVWPW